MKKWHPELLAYRKFLHVACPSFLSLYEPEGRIGKCVIVWGYNIDSGDIEIYEESGDGKGENEKKMKLEMSFDFPLNGKKVFFDFLTSIRSSLKVRSGLSEDDVKIGMVGYISIY